MQIKEVIKEGWKVDKIKIRYILKRREDIQKIVDNLEVDSRIGQRYESKDFKKCRMNYTIETKKGNIYVGIESNQIKISEDEKKKTLIIEYNPNKTNLFKEVEYLEQLKWLDLHRREIMYFDMAYDVFINIEDIKYSKRRTNEYECLISHKKLETIYLRKMGVNGTVRIYDKVLEMNGGNNEELEEETGEIKKIKYEGECTRYEIRIKPEKDLKKMINLLDPFLIEHLVKLHEIRIKEKSKEQKIIEEIEKNKNVDFNNLLLIHLGYIERIDKNVRKKYKELYKKIEKVAASKQQTTTKSLKNFNINELYKTFKTFLKSITFNNNTQLLLIDLLRKSKQTELKIPENGQTRADYI